MNSLDMRTVVFIGVVTDLICTWVIADLWRLNRRRYDGLALWFANFCCQSLGLLLIALRGGIPDWLSMIVANTLVTTGAFLGYLGLERFVGKKSRNVHNVLLLTAFVAVHTYLLYGYPTLCGRSVNVAVVLALFCAQCAWLLLRRVDAAMRPLTRWLGALYASFCLVFLIRAGLFLSRTDLPGDYFMTGLWGSVFHIVFLIQSILLMYGIVLTVSKRLLMEIRLQEEKYSKAFRSSPYGIVLTRLADGAILEANDSFLKAIGYSREEAMGRTTLDLKLWAHLRDREVTVAELNARGSVKGLEWEFLTRKGESLTVLYSAEVITVNNEKCILSSINDISRRKRAEEERERLLQEREKVLSEMKVLKGLLPICSSCKKIRDDRGYWSQLEVYIRDNSEADFSHSLCPECLRVMFPDIASHDGPTGNPAT